MSRNKLIMISTMMLTIVIVTGWLGDNKPSPVSTVVLEKSPELTLHASVDSECLSVPDYLSRYPDATPEEIIEIEQCHQLIERDDGPAQTDTGF